MSSLHLSTPDLHVRLARARLMATQLPEPGQDAAPETGPLLPREHFESRDGGCFLKPDGRRRFFVAYERRMERDFTAAQSARFEDFWFGPEEFIDLKTDRIVAYVF